MGANINGNFSNKNNKSNSLVKQFDVKNGLLGIKRDAFLLLLAYMVLESADSKTRNV
jgi:hypothetical protein